MKDQKESPNWMRSDIFSLEVKWALHENLDVHDSVDETEYDMKAKCHVYMNY